MIFFSTRTRTNSRSGNDNCGYLALRSCNGYISAQVDILLSLMTIYRQRWRSYVSGAIVARHHLEKDDICIRRPLNSPVRWFPFRPPRGGSSTWELWGPSWLSGGSTPTTKVITILETRNDQCCYHQMKPGPDILLLKKTGRRTMETAALHSARSIVPTNTKWTVSEWHAVPGPLQLKHEAFTQQGPNQVPRQTASVHDMSYNTKGKARTSKTRSNDL